MSGVFGQVAPIQVPDFGATAARAQGYQQNRLAMLMQQRQMQNEDALQGWFAQNGAGFSNADPQQRLNLLAQLAAQPGGARLALPMMPAEREALEWSGGGQAPAAPAAAAPAPGGSYVDRMVQMESGGRADARNPRSSATGAAQFIDGTWLQFARANPELFQGMSQDQILAARNNPDLSRRAADWYRRENLTTLAGQGLPANDGTAALAHRFGPGDAARLLRADQSAPIASIVSPQVMAANPDLNGRTVGQVVGQYAQRFGGDTVPASGGAPAPRDNNDLPAVPGFDLGRVRRAINLPNNAAAQRYLQSYMQAAGLVRRGETEPLERVRRPDGNEVLVPRSQASGMVSAPNPRETPGPFGSGERGRSLQAIEELGQIVARGEATPEQLMRYGSAVTNYQQEEIRSDGSRVTPRLPPYAPPMDWVAPPSSPAVSPRRALRRPFLPPLAALRLWAMLPLRRRPCRPLAALRGFLARVAACPATRRRWRAGRGGRSRNRRSPAKSVFRGWPASNGPTTRRCRPMATAGPTCGLRCGSGRASNCRRRNGSA